MTIWTARMVTKLVTLRNEGYSAREISVLMGSGITKGMVSGKLFRLGLSPQGSGRRTLFGQSPKHKPRTKNKWPARMMLHGDLRIPSGIDDELDDLGRG